MSEIEHHALLTVDEPCQLITLFDLPISKITLDLRGRTSIAKKSEKDNILGITTFSHTFKSITKDGTELKTKEELLSLLDKYKAANIANIYIICLKVEWQNSEQDIWNRNVLHITDKEITREIPSGRLNALTIATYTNDGVEKLQARYSSELVNSTTCKLIPIDKQKKRECLGTSPKVIKHETSIK